MKANPRSVPGYGEFQVLKATEGGKYLLAIPSKLFHSLTNGHNIADWESKTKFEVVREMETYSNVVVRFDPKAYPDATSLRSALKLPEPNRGTVKPVIAVPKRKGPRPNRTSKLRRSK